MHTPHIWKNVKWRYLRSTHDATWLRFTVQALLLPTTNPLATSIASAYHVLCLRSVRHLPRTARLSEGQSSEQPPQTQHSALPIERKHVTRLALCSQTVILDVRALGLTVSSWSQASLSAGVKSLIRPPGTPLLCQALVRGLNSSNRDFESASRSVDITVSSIASRCTGDNRRDDVGRIHAFSSLLFLVQRGRYR